METPQAGAPAPAARAGARWRLWLRAALPHALTAALAIAISLAVQATLPRAAPSSTPTAVVLPTTAPTSIATMPPEPTRASAPPPAVDIVRQELLDLHAEDDHVWSAIYLARAISQLADAETMLRANNLEGVDQVLVAVDDSLGLAYARAADPAKNPIEQLRRDAGAIRDDLYLRPEGMDARLTQLRQTILVLIEERR
jgi:hypothetical protein